MFDTITWQVDDRIGVLTLNRPAKLNALNRAMAHDVWQALDATEPLRVLIITGTGRAFSAGADLAEAQAGTSVDGPTWHEVWDRMVELPIPIIAAIDGYCLGGGLELALCCDLRVAGEGSRLGTPEALRGILPGGGGTQRLPRLIGPARAKELMLLCDHIDAATAERWGLVNRVVPAGEALAEARQLAERAIRAAPLALREIKRLVDQGTQMPIRGGLALERERARWLRGTDDAREGIRAFNEKRPPSWSGR